MKFEDLNPDSTVTMADGTRFIRIRNKVVMIDGDEITIDTYADVEAAEMVLDMAKENA